jgi:hypothetical protein
MIFRAYGGRIFRREFLALVTELIASCGIFAPTAFADSTNGVRRLSRFQHPGDGERVAGDGEQKHARGF